MLITLSMPHTGTQWKSERLRAVFDCVHQDESSLGPTTTPGTLEHVKTYYFKKLDSLFLVRVHRSNETGSASLNVLPSMTPRNIQQRLFMKGQWKRNCRLRERQADHESAEQVAVLCLAKTTQLI